MSIDCTYVISMPHIGKTEVVGPSYFPLKKNRSFLAKSALVMTATYHDKSFPSKVALLGVPGKNLLSWFQDDPQNCRCVCTEPIQVEGQEVWVRVGFHASVSASSLTLSKAYVPSSAEGKVHSSLVPSTHSFTFLTYLKWSLCFIADDMLWFHWQHCFLSGWFIK